MMPERIKAAKREPAANEQPTTAFDNVDVPMAIVQREEKNTNNQTV